MLMGSIVVITLLAGCSNADPRVEMATAIGDELATRMSDPIAQAAATGQAEGHEALDATLDSALDEMALPSDVDRILQGTHSGGSLGDGYADVDTSLLVFPTDNESMFCMVFGMSSTGEVVARPVLGDVFDQCAGAEPVRFDRP